MNRPRRPTFYKPEFADQPHKHCLMGATNQELAGAPRRRRLMRGCPTLGPPKKD